MVLQPESSPLRDGFCIIISQSELAQVKLNIHPQMTEKPTAPCSPPSLDLFQCVDLPLQRGHSAQGWTLPARLPTALCRPSTSRTQKHVSHEDTCVWQRRPGRCFHLLSRTEKHGWKCSIQVLRSHRVGWGGRDHCTRPSLAALQLFILTLEQRTASASRPL